MANKMSIEQARAIGAEIARAHKKWGKHASVNYTEPELFAAVTVLIEALDDTSQAAELTKVRRQLAVCRNRELARKKPQNGSALEHVGENEEVT